MNSSEPENRSRPASLHSQAQHRQGRPGREGDRWGVRAGLARSQPSQERPDSDQPRLAQGQPTSRERPLTDHYPPQASPLQWTPHTPLISDNKLMMVIGIVIGTAIKVKPRLGVLLLLYRFKSKFICPASTHTCVYLATPVMLQQAFREKATVANFAADSSSHPSER